MNPNPLWIQSLAAGQPSTFLGYPVVDGVEDLQAIGAGNVPLMFGGLKQAYRVYDLVGTSMLRDPYSYNAYIAIKVFKHFDGIVANTEAVLLLKIADSQAIRETNSHSKKNGQQWPVFCLNLYVIFQYTPNFTCLPNISCPSLSFLYNCNVESI